MVILGDLQFVNFSVAAAAEGAAAAAAAAAFRVASAARCFSFRRRRSTVVSACCSLCSLFASLCSNFSPMYLSCIIIGITCRLSNFRCDVDKSSFIGDLRPSLCVPPVLAGVRPFRRFFGVSKGAPVLCLYAPLAKS